jgi:hypothetical protein
MSVRTSIVGLVSFVLALSLAACSPQQGDSCTSSSSCGSSLVCGSCNIPDGSTSVCQHPCATDSDCAGTSGPTGPTPACTMDSCGGHFCGIRI